MYLLYLDDSGSANNLAENNLVIGGLAVFERDIRWFVTQMDNLAKEIEPDNHRNIEFHASEIFSRRKAPWNRMTKDEAINVIKRVLSIAAESYERNVAFACVIDKKSYAGDPVKIAFEDLCSRFELKLRRENYKNENASHQHRGLIVLDRSSYETTLHEMSLNFMELGTRWSGVRNIADVPFFVDSKASRVVQIADHIAYSVFRRYERGDSSYLDLIMHKFDSEEGTIHGISHKHNDLSCYCPACLSRHK